MIKKGTILRVTTAVEGAASPQNLLGRRVGWAITVDCDYSDNGDIYVQWLSPTSEECPRLDLCPYLFEPAGDKWIVPDEREVPDKVWAALAKWRLLGGDA